MTARSRRHGSSRSKCRPGVPFHLAFDCCSLVILRVCCSLFSSGRRIRMSTPLHHHNTSATPACFEESKTQFSTAPIEAAPCRQRITTSDLPSPPVIQSHRDLRPPTIEYWNRVLRPVLPCFRIRQTILSLGQIMTTQCVLKSRMMQLGISGAHGTSRSMATASSSSAQSSHTDLQSMGFY